MRGISIPKSTEELLRTFADEEACRDFLLRIRWPKKFCCPRCLSKGRPWSTRLGMLVCIHCEHQTSVTVGTVLERSKLPLSLWIQAMWSFSEIAEEEEHGISARQLQIELGLSRYQTAYELLKRIRRGLTFGERLEGRVVLFRRGLPIGTGGQTRDPGELVPVVFAVEIADDEVGRIAIQILPQISMEVVLDFMTRSLSEDCEVIPTDGMDPGHLRAAGYQVTSPNPLELEARGFKSTSLLTDAEFVNQDLGFWLATTYRNRMHRAELEPYSDEFRYRFNRLRRLSKRRLPGPGRRFFDLAKRLMAPIDLRRRG